jgi:hypothetical protein
VSSPAEARLLPPPPAAVAAYFQRRRSSIAEFTPEDLASNERLWLEICGLPAAPAAGMPTGAAQSPAGEQIGGCGYPSTPPGSLQIPECAEAIAAPREIQVSLPRAPRASARRACHRRVEPRGTGRWAQKRRLVRQHRAHGLL